jgi:threonine/homoserine/homoserine lactone efflux protein
MYVLVIKSVVAGLLIALPTGPVGLLCLRRTLTEGRRAGLVSGLGTAAADLCYLVVIQLGLTALSPSLAGGRHWLRIGGGLLLVIAGTKIMFAPKPEALPPAQSYRLKGHFATAFLLTISNPTLLITLTALVAALDLQNVRGDYLAASLSLACIFGGSAAWWLAITGMVNQLHSRLAGSTINKIDKVAGAAIAALGLGLLLS